MSRCSFLPRSVRRFAALAALCLVVPVALLSETRGAAAADAPAADEAGFTPLFNGKDLSGWDGEPGVWKFVDGMIVGEPPADKPLKANSFLVWRDGNVDDFVLRCSFRVEKGNSGIQYRSVEVDKWRVKGYQADMEAGKKYTGMLYEERDRGILCPRGEKVVVGADGKKQVTPLPNAAQLQSHIKNGDWNDYEVIAQGNHFIQKINGLVTADVTDNDPKNFRSSGLLALQTHAGMAMKVEFKNVRLKRTKLTQGKKIVLVAGRPSHGYGAHDFHAGVMLLKKRLDTVPGIVTAEYFNGWPKDPTAFDNADAVVLYMDGGPGHPAIAHLKEIQALMAKGVGLMCMHYAVEIPAGAPGNAFKDWIGGYYESGFSINPHWIAQAELDTSHPIARGVKPFAVKDEWYFNMRFRDDTKGIAKVLQAKPDDEARSGNTASPRGVRKHIVDAKGRMETLLWAVERPDGGRGVGFTGGHFHSNWADDNYRKLVLNAIVWVSGHDVPAAGIESEKVTPAELEENADEPMPKKK